MQSAGGLRVSVPQRWAGSGVVAAGVLGRGGSVCRASIAASGTAQHTPGAAQGAESRLRRGFAFRALSLRRAVSHPAIPRPFPVVVGGLPAFDSRCRVRCWPCRGRCGGHRARLVACSGGSAPIRRRKAPMSVVVAGAVVVVPLVAVPQEGGGAELELAGADSTKLAYRLRQTAMHQPRFAVQTGDRRSTAATGHHLRSA